MINANKGVIVAVTVPPLFPLLLLLPVACVSSLPAAVAPLLPKLRAHVSPLMPVNTQIKRACEYIRSPSCNSRVAFTHALIVDEKFKFVENLRNNF